MLPIAPPAPPMLWPLKGRIMTPFRGRKGRHDGIDIDGEAGNPIRAADSGRVVSAGRDGAYGLRVILDHGKGLTTFYAHASVILVNPGDLVKKGDVIARVGRTGNAHGTHLHFEVRRNDKPIDPKPFLD
jgi:murein DD-endopeptidase MepM/ murein hydrolase activator NlpD